MSYFGPTDFLIEVKKGNIPGHSLVHKFGRNDGVPNGSWEFINLLGFTAWPLSAATTVRVKAGNAADTAAGAGAQEITVQGIAADLTETSEAIATAGTSASSVTSASFWRIHRAWVSSIGAYGAGNTGVVTIENGAGGTDLIQIAAGEGQTQFTGFSIPTGKTGYLLSVNITVDSTVGKEANIRLMTRGDLNDTSAPMKSVRLKKHFDGVLGHLSYTPRSPDVSFPALTDVWIEAYGAGNATEVSADMEILLIDD